MMMMMVMMMTMMSPQVKRLSLYHGEKPIIRYVSTWDWNPDIVMLWCCDDMISSWHDILLSWNDMILSWHDMILSWHDMMTWWYAPAWVFGMTWWWWWHWVYLQMITWWCNDMKFWWLLLVTFFMIGWCQNICGPSTERPVTASTPTRIVTNFFIALNWRLSFTRHIQRPWSPRLAWDDGDDGVMMIMMIVRMIGDDDNDSLWTVYCSQSGSREGEFGCLPDTRWQAGRTAQLAW